MIDLIKSLCVSKNLFIINFYYKNDDGLKPRQVLRMAVSNKNKSECCGCNACAEICPKQCIQMVEDSRGFSYPKVNHTVCVECGACEQVCPFNQEKTFLRPPITAYAVWNKNREEYLRSSSGGAAHVLASYVLKQGGVVYGCTAEGTDVYHIRIQHPSELYRIQGSKYVQSEVRGVFKQVRDDLKNNIPVLFIGTPCQVAGLKSFIKHIPDKLYLVDLICHGVPSQKMLKEHVAFIHHSQSIKDLSFRKGQMFLFEFKDHKGTFYTSESHKDMYYRSFLNGISYRESCYHCLFARQERVSDITIGDFWGVSNVKAVPLNSEEGVSMVLPVSEKGQKLINLTMANMHIYERSIKEAVAGNEQLSHPVKETVRVKFFRLLYPVLSFDVAVSMCILDSKMQALMRIINKKIKRE